MKNYFLILLATISLLNTSCSKGDKNHSQDPIVGVWNRVGAYTIYDDASNRPDNDVTWTSCYEVRQFEYLPSGKFIETTFNDGDGDINNQNPTSCIVKEILESEAYTWTAHDKLNYTLLKEEYRDNRDDYEITFPDANTMIQTHYNFEYIKESRYIFKRVNK